MSKRPFGWDGRAISRIAKARYGGFKEMFVAHGWPETGRAMVPAIRARINEKYGSVEAFCQRNGYDPDAPENAL